MMWGMTYEVDVEPSSPGGGTTRRTLGKIGGADLCLRGMGAFRLGYRCHARMKHKVAAAACARPHPPFGHLSEIGEADLRDLAGEESE